MSALVQLPADYVPRFLESGQKVGSAALGKLASTRRGANAWTNDGRQWIELGLAELRLAERDQSNRQASVERAVTAFRRGLARKPADGRGWMWLAEAELLRGGPTPAVARAIEMSIRTAPYDRTHHMARLEIALAIWAQLETEGRVAVTRQVRIAQRQYPHQLAKLAQDDGYSDLVQNILDGRAIRSQL